ncbi:Zinc finger SWIM domain-containing protein 3 [Frankliniella fusca]|uniref:Zinc finger SWIM domain-containing protein 3 n=1 Tax=Frankliniella fusca TaxID=407009 RepID=A0AAE1LMN6_9NEOP|nr:Zinc finger SWIM domain-containing protein 3 [Frankliniella fusca]
MPSVFSKLKEAEPCPPDIRKGSSHSSFAEVEKAMEKFEIKNSVRYVRNGSKLVKTYNSQHGTDYPECLKYFRAKYTCKHYGPPRTNSKGIRPNQNTFKQYCPASVIFQACPITRKLVVNKVVEKHVHNHETEPDDLPKYPEKRRKNMDPDLIEEVENLIDLNVEPTRLLDYLETFKNISLTAQDIANIKTDSEEFFDELENLLQKDPGPKVIYGAEYIGCDEGEEECDEEDCDDPSTNQRKEKTQLSYVYFHTSEMGETFDRYSDVLVADSTYCTNTYDMPLMVFLCLDAHGNGRVAGYCLRRSESKVNVKNAAKAFCQAHPAAQDNVKTVLVDKDHNEREAIREFFPEAIVHICLFHTLQIFNRRTKGEPDATNGIAYCPTKEGYSELYSKLQSTASQDFMRYYNENWHNCQECWAMFHRDLSINCGQTTTNLAERHRQKIKAILKKKRANMAELLRNLLLLHSSKTSRTAMNTFNGKVKVRYVTNNNDPIVQEISRSTTPFVGDLLKAQYNWAVEQASRLFL